MTARAGRNSRASLPSSATSLFAVSTDSDHVSPSARTRSSVERPTEPVAPKSERRRFISDRRPDGDMPKQRKRAEEQRDRQQPVDAIEEAAVPGDELA